MPTVFPLYGHTSRAGSLKHMGAPASGLNVDMHAIEKQQPATGSHFVECCLQFGGLDKGSEVSWRCIVRYQPGLPRPFHLGGRMTAEIEHEGVPATADSPGRLIHGLQNGGFGGLLVYHQIDSDVGLDGALIQSGDHGLGI